MDAAAADARWQRDSLALHGIPVTMDLEPVRGMPFEGGTYLRHDVSPPTTSWSRACASRRISRQDHDARIRLEGRQPKSSDRHYAYPWKLKRRRVFTGGRRRCSGYGPLHQGSGRRLDPHARAFLQRVRIEADLWTRPQSPMAPSDTVHLGPMTRTLPMRYAQGDGPSPR